MTDESIKETKDVVTTFIQLVNQTPAQYADELVAKKLRCKNVYEEKDLSEFFIKWLDKSNTQSKNGYWCTRYS